MLHKRSKQRGDTSRIKFKPLNPAEAEAAARDEATFAVEIPRQRELTELNNVGLLLRADRLRRGEDLSDVAKTLKIQFKYLSALEDGRYEDLPEGPYAMGFVRAYADYLGLDAQEIMRRFKLECQQVTVKSDLVFPTPEPEARIPSGAVVLLSALLAVGAYGGWYYLASQDRAAVAVVEPVPERLSELVAATPATAPSPVVAAMPLQTLTSEEQGTPSELSAVTATLSEPTGQREIISSEAVTPTIELASAEPMAEDVVEDVSDSVEEENLGIPLAELAAVVATPETGTADQSAQVSLLAEAMPVVKPQPIQVGLEAQTGVPVESAVQETPIITPAVATAANLPQAPAVTELAAIPAAPMIADEAVSNMSSDSRITLRATERLYVRVVGRDDRLLLSRMLMPGEIYQAPNVPQLSLQTGNAGALEIEVDGTKMPPIGEFGEVIKDYHLHPDELLSRIGQAQ